ncbi:MAG: 5'-nucleotidase SurE, partial [uncultured Gemmatimonadaceae bacterium]
APPVHERRRHPRPRARLPRPRGRALGRGHRRGPRPRAERDQPLAHAPPPRAPGAARRPPLPGGRHPHRLRDARGGGAHAGPPRLRAERDQPRAEHGRGRALLGHRRGGDGRALARRAGDRGVVRRRRPPRRRLATGRAGAGALGPAAPPHGAAALSQGHAAQHQPSPGLERRGEGGEAHPPRPPGLLQLDRADAGPVGAADLLDRRRLAELDGRGRLRLPGGAGRLHLGDPVAPRPHEPRRARGGGIMVAGPL